MSMTDEIPFHRVTVLGTEQGYIQDAIARGGLCGDRHYGRRGDGSRL